ncbi:uncharacterized protein LOC9640737 isoform X1 [Selaginella moellendorffii]|uniref:uncharacterized protein LOC9640737 isoform X1 n=1 Tax=Selaginella moellendorffii TaxID=88036 RepID=UPI000D1C5799|nr:uncharacterized protein LOC9640737 isoform X1 [Selaginella moellendorffii]|eukprot:XP_002985833.2 uncharacterized protein LOC9640737 isoform X1 [Selaginella moellendorffii]
MERLCVATGPLLSSARGARFLPSRTSRGVIPGVACKSRQARCLSAARDEQGQNAGSSQRQSAALDQSDEDDVDAATLTEADFEDFTIEDEEEDEEEEDFFGEEESRADIDVTPQAQGKGRRRRRDRVKGPEVPSHLLPKVAIVGRPNVGKSALFNRIVGRNMAIVHDEPGVTRDRLYGRVRGSVQEFMLIDTGGVLTIPTSAESGLAGGSVAAAQAKKDAAAAGLPSMIEQQAASAVEEACALVFVVDGQAGLTSADIEIGNWLRRKFKHKKIALAVNKCESPKKGLLQAAEFWSLGFTPVPVSAISGSGVPDLLEDVTSAIKEKQDELEASEGDRPLSVAIIGRPNVGKSSILNAIVGKERTIVSPVSGTTRDAIDTEVTGPEGKVFRLIDTAGIRKRAAIASGGSKTESLCVQSALRAIRRADVVALVIEAMTCATEQDYRLGERIEKDGKACIIVVNKWDTVPDKNAESTYWYDMDVREKLRVLKWAPIVYTSATSGQRVQKILATALSAGQERERRISTAILNQVVQDAINMKQPPTTRGGRKGRLYFCTQATTRPPTFVFFVNDEKLFPDDYKRYMEKQLRQNIGFPGTPIRLFWRSKRLARPGSKQSTQELASV